MVGSLLDSVLNVISSSDRDKSHNGETATIRKRKVAIALKHVNRLKRGILIEPSFIVGLQRSRGAPQRTLCSAAFNSLSLLRLLIYTILQPLFSKA
jgi:hypothetical protein